MLFVRLCVARGGGGHPLKVKSSKASERSIVLERCGASKSTAAHDPNYFLINYLLRHLMEYLLLLPNRIMIRVVLSPISFIASLLASQPASWLSITDSVYMQIMVTNQATNAQLACTHGQLGRRAATRPKCAPNALQEVSKQLLLGMYVHTRYKNPSGLSVCLHTSRL